MINIINESKKVRIVLVDSGINTAENNLNNSLIDEVGISFDTSMNVIERSKPIVENDHGTVIAETIKSICNNVEFISINILDKNLTTNGRILLAALKKAMSYNPNIVHLSLGTTKLKYWFHLRKITKTLNRNNVIIVSAAENNGRKSYPAYLKHVVGVKGTNLKNDEFYYNNNFFYSPLYLPDVIINSNEKYKHICGNSISAAYITGHICNIILKLNIKKNNEIVDCLKSEGMKNYRNYNK